MKRFHFRLDALLDMKKRAEEDVKKELAKKNAEIASARKEREDIGARLSVFLVEEKEQRLRVLDLLALRFSISYRGHLQREMADRDRLLEKLAAEAERIRLRLVAARKETRVLELLREKRLARWKKEYRKEEREYLDDVSQKGYVRRLGAGRGADPGVAAA